MEIVTLNPETFNLYKLDLAELLCDAVNDGASVGFWPPLGTEKAAEYWTRLAPQIADGSRIALIAQMDGRVVGTVMLQFSQFDNGCHRAEVQKLLVHTAFRRRGIARRLLEAVDQAARQQGRTLLVLDTQRGDAAEQLYLAYGYQVAGIVPNFVKDQDGNYHATVYFYRILG